MGKNARLRKLRREARQQFGLDPAKGGFASTYQKQHRGVVLCTGAGQKMSQVLEEFAQPLLRVADSPEDTKRALLLAMAAWNYSLLDDPAEPDALHSTLLADPPTREVFDFLLARKQELYPDNRRIILDFQLIPNGTELQFNVISTPA